MTGKGVKAPFRSADVPTSLLEGDVMLRQFLVGGAASTCNIVIHALVMTAVVLASQATVARVASRSNLILIAVMIATVSVLMAAHTCEVIVWSLAYGLVDAAPTDTKLLYFAFVNYTTLGYGDVVPVERWQLLGPITAMNGVLMFGWSTAVIFEVLRKTMAITGRGGT
jgi:hypothetical protein